MSGRDAIKDAIEQAFESYGSVVFFPQQFEECGLAANILEATQALRELELEGMLACRVELRCTAHGHRMFAGHPLELPRDARRYCAECDDCPRDVGDLYLRYELTAVWRSTGGGRRVRGVPSALRTEPKEDAIGPLTQSIVNIVYGNQFHAAEGSSFKDINVAMTDAEPKSKSKAKIVSRSSDLDRISVSGGDADIDAEDSTLRDIVVGQEAAPRTSEGFARRHASAIIGAIAAVVAALIAAAAALLK